MVCVQCQTKIGYFRLSFINSETMSWKEHMLEKGLVYVGDLK
jgi:hypothetical protein